MGSQLWKVVLLLGTSFQPIKTAVRTPEVTAPSDLPGFADVIPNVTVALGRDAEIPCVVDNLGSYRTAWIKVETKAILTIYRHVITRNYRYSLKESDGRNFVLHITDVQESDRGGYMCQINTVPMLSQVGYLDVLIPPDIIVDKSTSDLVTREGSNVTLECKAKGYPEPNITWRREDGEPIPMSQEGGHKVIKLRHEGEHLIITRVTRLHMGAYLCIASNGVPPSVSRRILLHVHFPPVLWVPSQLVGAQPWQEVTLDCHAEAYPQSFNYWKREDGKMIMSNDKYKVRLKQKSYKVHMRLTIRNIQKEDFGSYSCLTRNSLGMTEGLIKLYDFPKHQSLGSEKSSEGFQNSNSIPGPQVGTSGSVTTGFQRLLLLFFVIRTMANDLWTIT
ncbi:lachesin-like isoform X2 [Tachypleus tridentatus]|uniref:lachesin-like isoform X2 n=1 Tax=Tachypleus tridentatus TaxID=6853 RepID=UPI003FD0178A